MPNLSHNADVAVTVYFRRPKDGDNGYISAYSKYPSSDDVEYHPGNDLSDGKYVDETVENVVADIKAVMNGYRNAYEASLESKE